MTVEPTTPETVLRAERLSIDSDFVPYRRAVLRVETTTEEVLVPVTITRQHARVEYVDLDVPAVGEAPAPRTTDWVTLHVDEPVVGTRPVPVERVRLATEWVAGVEQVQAELTHQEVVLETAPSAPTAPAQRG